MCEGSDGGDIEELTGIVLDSWEEDQGCCGTMFGNDRQNLVCGEG